MIFVLFFLLSSACLNKAYCAQAYYTVKKKRLMLQDGGSERSANVTASDEINNDAFQQEIDDDKSNKCKSRVKPRRSTEEYRIKHASEEKQRRNRIKKQQDARIKELEKKLTDAQKTIQNLNQVIAASHLTQHSASSHVSSS